MHLFDMVVALEGSSGNIKPCCKRQRPQILRWKNEDDPV